MIYLEKIYIKNFRKIIEQKIDLTDINIFVGLNDVGKSTILKALNLFFNNETESSQKFNFNEDFSKNHKTNRNKAKEIVIELEFKTPVTYKESQNILWRKSWRQDGLNEDEIKYVDGEEIPPKKKLKAWVRKIKYMYVPAVKGQDYFIELLGKLHDTLAVAIGEELRKASDNFSTEIKKSTEGITKEIENKIKLLSILDLPQDLRNIFRSLEFKTGKEDILLSHRGDGIKTRHIPVILKFIAEQENLQKIKGTPAVNTIWGYEEPENSLEMLAAFELAKNLYEYSEDIQMLITTHSPAFYSIELQEEIDKNFKITWPVNVNFVEEDTNNGIKIINKKDHILDIDKKTGILFLLEPKIKETLNENIKMNNELSKFKKDKIIVEGKTDKIVFEKAIEIFSPNLKKLISEKKISIEHSESGADGVANNLIIAAHGSQFKCFGIFDEDFTGKQKKNSLEECPRCVEQRGKKIQFKLLLLNPQLGAIRQEFPTFDFELEELFGEEAWDYAENQGYLERRDLRIPPKLPVDKSPKDFFESKFSNKHILRLCINKINDSKKDEFAEWVIQNNPSKNLESFGPLIKTIEEFFSKI